MSKTPRRRWFSFSLRTLLLVVAICGVVFGCVGYYVDWIRQRRYAADVWVHVSAFLPPDASYQIPNPPWPLGLLGEQGYGCLMRYSPNPLSADDEAELSRTKALFPEAEIIWVVVEQQRTSDIDQPASQ